jgi:hypothetical protein
MNLFGPFNPKKIPWEKVGDSRNNNKKEKRERSSPMIEIRFGTWAI